MRPLARVSDERLGDVAIAGIDGEVDSSNAHEIGARLRDLLTNRSEGLVVDLTATRYHDSAGINLLFELGGELEERQQQLQLVVAPASPIARMVAITGLDTQFPTHPTRQAALER